MDDLIAFLNARLDEDEREATEAGSSSWVVETHRNTAGRDIGSEVHPAVTCDLDGSGGCDTNYARHIVRHDPARVLADVDAKRQIIEWCADMIEGQEKITELVNKGIGHFDELDSDMLSESETRAEDHRRILRLLALPFAGHPDYREDFRP